MKGIIKTLKTYNLTKEHSIIAGEIRQKLLEKRIDINEKDILIATICIENSLTLITNNKKHFLPFQEFGLKML
jgi:predicted nucleic acid-binding protein